jgi:thioredoxin 1
MGYMLKTSLFSKEPTMSEMAITDQNFSTEIEESTGVALVDFWAPWCGPCRMLGPIIEQLAEELEGKVKIGKLNVDENSNTPSRFGVMGIPTMIIFKDGKEVDKLVGALPKEQILNKINQYL